MDEVEKELIYFVDPMCSWCWGFSPTIGKIASNLKEGVGIRTIMGGLRPFTKEVMTEEMKTYILGHWRHVYDQSGQPFDLDFSIGDDFIYDTEPASRAMITVREINKDLMFEYLNKIQMGFYRDMKNITKEEVLACFAEELEIDKMVFLELFASDELKTLTKKDFNTSQSQGVHGFPTILARTGQELMVITQGFQSFENLKANLEEFVAL